MKRIITVCWAISILCAVYPAKADILSWLKPTPKPVVAPRHHITPDEIQGENDIMAKKEAAEQARFAAWRKDHPEPDGPPQPPGPWCLIGHLPSHPGLNPIVCGYHSEAECTAHKLPKTTCAR